MIGEITCDKCGGCFPPNSMYCNHCGDGYRPCPVCGADNPDDVENCLQCQAPLSGTKTNTKQYVKCGCGELVNSDAKFCDECGNKVIEKEVGKTNHGGGVNIGNNSHGNEISISLQDGCGGTNVGGYSHNEINNVTQDENVSGFVPPEDKSMDPKYENDCPLNLEFNANSRFIADSIGYLDIRVINKSEEPISSINLEFNFLDQAINENRHDLKPGSTTMIRFKLKTKEPGRCPVDLSLKIYSKFTTKRWNCVLHIPVYPKITGDVNVNNVLNIGDCSHGNEVEFNNPDFSEFKSRDGIISGNIQADFKRLVLEEHFDSIDGGRLRLLPCTDVPSLEKMTLTIDSPTGQKNIMIISKNLVKFGRVVCDPQTPMIVNDIITQIYSSDRTECKSNLRYISRYHSEMYLGENSITIKCKSNMEKGLLFDKRMVRYGEKANLKVGDSAEMKFNAKLLLQAKVFPHTHNSGNSGISYMNPFLDWKGSGEIACVKISRLNNAFHEEYLLLAKEAQIGNDETCAITIPGNEINNPHARIVRVSNRYWLASCGPTPVEYDDGDGFKDLMNRKAVPLRIGMKIRLHKDVSISVSEFKQVAVYK